jgi:glucosylglycerate phosphorylase
MTHPLDRVREHLTVLYGKGPGAEAYARMTAILSAFALRRPPIAPRRRLNQDDVILITYGDQVQEPERPPLQSLADLLDNAFGRVVSGVHILPFYPYTSDDGFSVVDYLAVDPALGSWDDVSALGTHYRLMFDAVVNHISAASQWFQAFLAGDAEAAARFHIVNPATDLSGVTRPRTTPLLTPFETPSGTQHVWTTFSADQIDLNFTNPELLIEMTNVLLEYVARGANLIRLDAIGYLWKRIGTSCIHLPETHRVVQFWRACLDAVAPEVMLITETNVPHADNISYFGNGTNEAQLVYQFPLAPLVLHAFTAGDAAPLSNWARNLVPPAPRTAFFNFLASHDGIGVVPASGLLTPEQVAALCTRVERHGGRVSYKNNPDGSQSAYELNCTWFDALSDPAADEPDGRTIDRFVASQALMLALQGVPGLYVHSLVGSGNYHAGLAETGRARTLNREKWQRAELEARLADANSRAAQVFGRMATLIHARRNEAGFHPNAAQRVCDMGSAIFALERLTPDGTAHLLCLHNVSEQPVTARLDLEAGAALRDLVTGADYTADAAGALALELVPYQVLWLKRKDAAAW